MNGGESNMQPQPIDEVVLTRYLLGNLTETEEIQVEDRAFADPEYLTALETAEADLIDTYVNGGLSPAERRSFERRFLMSPTRWKKVEFARALAKVAAESAPRPVRRRWMEWLRGPRPSLRFAAAFAGLICVVGISWLTFQNGRMKSRLLALEQERGELTARQDSLQRQLLEQRAAAAAPAPPQAPVAASAIASLVLLPGISRSETRIELLQLSSSAQLARIEIPLEARDEFPRFEVELRTRRGEGVLTRSNLARQRAGSGYVVSFDVPASALAPGDYELTLKGTGGQGGTARSETVGYYYFRVRKDAQGG